MFSSGATAEDRLGAFDKTRKGLRVIIVLSLFFYCALAHASSLSACASTRLAAFMRSCVHPHTTYIVFGARVLSPIATLALFSVSAALFACQDTNPSTFNAHRTSALCR